MTLEVDDKVTICGLSSEVRRDTHGYYLTGRGDIFEKLNISNPHAYVSKLVGYKAGTWSFPEVRTLEDLTKVVRALKGEGVVKITPDALVALINVSIPQARRLVLDILEKQNTMYISNGELKSMEAVAPGWVMAVKDDNRPLLTEGGLRKWLEMNPASHVGHDLIRPMFMNSGQLKVDRTDYDRFRQEACTEADAEWLVTNFGE